MGVLESFTPPSGSGGGGGGESGAHLPAVLPGGT